MNAVQTISVLLMELGLSPSEKKQKSGNETSSDENVDASRWYNRLPNEGR